MILVLAGKREEFDQWCRDNGITQPRGIATYVHSAYSLKGWENPTLVRTGQFWINPARQEFDELEQKLKHACR